MTDILSQDIMYLPGVGPHRKDLLDSQLHIKTWGDLLGYYPYKYVDRTKFYRIAEFQSPMLFDNVASAGSLPFVQIKGRILSYDTYTDPGQKRRVVAHFSDGSGVVDLVWFHGLRYVTQTYKIGQEYIVFGRPRSSNSDGSLPIPTWKKSGRPMSRRWACNLII